MDKRSFLSVGKPVSLIAGILLGALLLAPGSLAGEETSYEKAFQAGQDLEKAGKFAEARAEFEKALAVPGITPDQTGQTLIKVGSSLISEKKIEASLAKLEKAFNTSGVSSQTKIQANLLFGQTALAWSWQFSWLLAKSRDAFAQTVELPDITPDQKTAAQKGLVKALMGLKQFSEARAAMVKLAANPSLTPAEKLATQLEIASTCMLEKKYPEARAELSKALSMEGVTETDKADIQLKVGLSYFYEKDFEQAKPELEKVLTMPTAHAQRVKLDGWVRTVPSAEANLRLRKMNPAGDKGKTITALFIGCSMTMRGMMPNVVEQLAASAPADRPRIIAAMHVRGGTRLGVHWDAGEAHDTARGMISEELWDVVVLDTFNTQKPEDLVKPGQLFVDLARSKNIKPILYESQPVQATPFPEGYQKYHEDNATLGKTLGSPLAPIALAEMNYLKAVPNSKIGMFYDDWIHPSGKGVYLAACCIYSAITGYSPVGLSSQGIPDDDAKALQEAAWQAVQEANPDLKPWKGL
jgi:tetratricopeptide (TPR) repeat protein